MSAVNVTLCESIASPDMLSLKVEGVSLLNNIRYEDEGIRLWKAYGVGSGKLIKLQYPSASELPTLTATHTHTSMFASIKPRRTTQHVPHERASDDQADQDTYTDGNFISTQEAAFACPEEGCTHTFLRHSSSQRHLDCGKHERALEHLSEQSCSGLCREPSSVPEGIANTSPEDTLSASEKLSMGWALKASSTRQSRFTASQKSYLTNRFKLGELTGQKADPASVARVMASAKDASGNHLFTSDDFLSANQIAGFFSRLSAKNTRHEDVERMAEDDFQSAADEASIEELTNVAVQELQIRHPISYDVYNLCVMVARSKLKNFSVTVLKDICLFYNIDVTDITVHRKQPYVNKILSLCLSCVCQQQDS